MKSFACCILTLLVAASAAAQGGLYYPEPPASALTVSRDVRYGSADDTTLRMDVYRPAGRGAPRPALVFFTAGLARTHAGYSHWARIAASKGLVAILADLRVPTRAADFRMLLAHLTQRAAEYSIDSAAIAVFGASSNASNALVFVQDSRETRVKAAVLYYGGHDGVEPLLRIRRDLPLLYIRAGLDRPFVNASLDSVVMRALVENAPITVINHSSGHHGFEATDDDAITRVLIDQTVDFVKRVTAPAYRAALESGVGYATAAAHVFAGNFGAAATSYGELVSRSPNDPRLRLSYGEALLGDRQFAKACDEFAKLKGKGLGPRDLGLPAARACLQKGDADAAVAWLASIPKRFLPARVKDEPTFAPLKDRADFKALFDP